MCRFEKNVAQLGYRSASLLKSFSRLGPSVDTWSQRYGIWRDHSIRAAEGSKSGFGRQPVKKNKVGLHIHICAHLEACFSSVVMFKGYNHVVLQ